MISTSFNYRKIIKSGLSFGAKYRTYITIAVIAIIFGFTYLRIATYSDPMPDQDALVEKLAEYNRLDINEETVEKIKTLVDSDVEVNPQFENRDNPFAE